MVNVIHAKALPGFVLYVEHSIGDCEKQVATQMPCRETIRKALRVIIQILRALIYTEIYTNIVEGQSWSRYNDIMNHCNVKRQDCSKFENFGKVADMYVIDQDKH